MRKGGTQPWRALRVNLKREGSSNAIRLWSSLLCGWFVLTIDINYLQEMQNIWPHINELTELKSGAFCGQPGKHISNI